MAKSFEIPSVSFLASGGGGTLNSSSSGVFLSTQISSAASLEEIHSQQLCHLSRPTHLNEILVAPKLRIRRRLRAMREAIRY